MNQVSCFVKTSHEDKYNGQNSIASAQVLPDLRIQWKVGDLKTPLNVIVATPDKLWTTYLSPVRDTVHPTGNLAFEYW